MKRFFIALLFLTGCATVPEPQKPEAPPQPPPAPERRESVAIAGLMDSARGDIAAGRLANAAASLERGLRIEPRNPRLWHELARVRLLQGDRAQAETLATRSNTYAAGDAELRAANERLIQESKTRR